MMASDDKKTKADPVQKKEAPAKKKENQKSETIAKDNSPSGAEPSRPEGGEAVSDKPSNYSRGEGQKPVTHIYRENWNAIFAKKKKR